MSNNGFRVNAKNFALTFPATVELPFNKDQLLSHLVSIDGPIYVIVAKELHATGVPHYHALVTYSSKKNLRNPRYFDFMGAHANVQGCRSLSQWIAYVKKDGDFIEHGTAPVSTTVSEHSFPTPSDCDNEEEWLSRCLQREIPYGYAQRMWQLLQANDCLTIKEDYVPPAGSQVCPALQSFSPPDLTFHCLVIIGPSGCGKTTWAKQWCPKPALFVSTADDLKKLRAEHKCVIFDDCNFNHWPRESQIHLVDMYEPRSIHLRYSNALLPQGLLRVFTANSDPILLTDEAIRRRCKVFRLGQDFQHFGTSRNTNDTTG